MCWNVRHIMLLFLLPFALLCACQRHDTDLVETRRATSLPTTIASPELSAIDSLMWRQPDSALACLLPYFDTCRGDASIVSADISDDDSMEAHAMRLYNRHYANLLLAELLYKNDRAQTNRKELLQAVAYFDSLADTRGVSLQPNRHRWDARRASAQNTTATIAFLDARAHYINGVGYYEKDSMVDACKEYLKALEVMENHFEEKELVGKKAKFMTYTYNRLGDMFSEQFMMEPAIVCYKNSYEYSLISPISAYSISNALYRIGLQFNMKGEKDSANYYYSQALANMPDSTNLFYRNVVSSQTLLSYQLTHQVEAPLKRLKQMAALAEDEDERLTRYMVIGNIYFEEYFYDSACIYLEPVLESKDNGLLQIQVANYLRIIYDNLGNSEKSDECKHYLALHNETGAENSALVSLLSDMFKTYLSQKQEKEAEAKRETAVKKVLKVVVPIAIVLALAIIVPAKLRSKKLLKKHQEEADRKLGETEQQHKEELRQRQTEAEQMLEAKEKRHQQEMEEKEAKTRKELEEMDKQYTETIETERRARRMEQAVMSGRLKRSNQKARELKGQIRQQDEKYATPEQAKSFEDEPICRLIIERVKNGQFKSKVSYLEYKDSALNRQQLFALRVAADQHFGQFTVRLKDAYPQLTNSDLDYCCLYLLGLTDADIAALMQRAYNTVVERDGKLKKVFGINKPLPLTMISLANEQLFI